MLESAERFAKMERVMTGSDLKAARIARGWTQTQLGELIGETKTVVGNWERGDHIPPRKEGAVRRVLFPESTEDALREFSNSRLVSEITAMVAELALRLDRAESAANRDADPPDAHNVDENPDSIPRVRTTSVEGTAGPHSPPRMR